MNTLSITTIKCQGCEQEFEQNDRLEMTRGLCVDCAKDAWEDEKYQWGEREDEPPFATEIL